MGAGEPSAAGHTRSRIYSVALIVITIVVVLLALLLPAILNRYTVLPPPTPTPGANVQLDAYASGSGWAHQFGDDPVVAVSSNGTVATAWEGLDELAPPSTPDGLPTYTSMIFVSYSYNGGQSYSVPEAVGSAGTTAADEPALAFAANGTLLLAYANATNSDDQEIVVVAAPAGQPFGAGHDAEAGQQLGSPFLFVLPSGAVVLAFDYDTVVEWALSTNGGASFQAPVILTQGLLTGGTLWDGDMVTLVGLSAGALTFTTVSTWSATFNATGVGPVALGSPVTLAIPYPTAPGPANLSRPGPVVTRADGQLYLVYAAANESSLRFQTSSTNGSSWSANFTVWHGRNVSIETPAVAPIPGSSSLVFSWQSTEGGYWGTYTSVYSLETGLLSTPVEVSSAPGFPADVRNWHGTSMGLAIASATTMVVVWGDGRGLAGTYGLTHIYACTLDAELG